MQQDERRAPEVRRVPIATLVEICGQDPSVPNFEAESVEVSGRGMCVRTEYLPEVGSPLVCRFEDRGREVLVEGLVAWRDEDARGGEFGIRFTALDSRSVDVLRDLCGVGDTSATPAPPDAESEAPDAIATAAPGSRVRLHIEGLGSPMKARVRENTRRRVDVGSNLEFLKVGKALELEGGEDRREAIIDAVTVAIDPQTQIPQLVVTLRYADVEDSTPEPSVIGDDEADDDEIIHSAPAPTASSAELDDASVDALDPGDEMLAEADALKGRIGKMAVGAGAAMSVAGDRVAKLSSRAAVGLGRFLQKAQGQVTDKVGELRERGGSRPRRTTAAPPTGTLSSGLVRRQGAPAPEANAPAAAPTPPNKKRRVVVGAVAASLVVAGVAFGMRGGSAEPPGAEAKPGAAVATEAVATDVVAVNEQGDPVAAAPPGAEAAPVAVADTSGGITANIPLFGPTPMATMEPAPLEAPGEESEEEDPSASKSVAADESWEEDSAEAATPKKPAEKKVDPASVKPWGRGKVRTPTIHRIRLDRPGAAIQGAINPTGFTVVIPGRKTMESGNGIAKRDKRIARVRTRNTSSGAQVAFQFKDGVPGYRVRLRKDFVEFIVSAPATKK